MTPEQIVTVVTAVLAGGLGKSIFDAIVNKRTESGKQKRGEVAVMAQRLLESEENCLAAKAEADARVKVAEEAAEKRVRAAEESERNYSRRERIALEYASLLKRKLYEAGVPSAEIPDLDLRDDRRR